MRISDVLRGKGTVVHTVMPTSTVRDFVAILAEHHIGAMVVSTDGSAVDGIVSERDVVRALAVRGAAVLSEQIADIMTVDVKTCEPSAAVDELVAIMTEGRFRHVPVVVDGKLTGIVSIGDVVKIRMIELDSEREALAAYIAAGTT